MKKIIALGLSFAFIGAALIPFTQASRDRYYATTSQGKGKERRFSSRIAPFDAKRYRKRERVTRYTKRYQTYNEPKVARVTRGDKFVNVRSHNIPFYFSVPDGFRQQEDTLQWDSGATIYKKDNTTIEIKATDFRCDGGRTYQYHCLEEETKEMTSKLLETVPKMRKTKRKLISLQGSDLGQAGKSFSAWYLVFENTQEKMIQITFLEPTHKFLWGIQLRSENDPEGFLKDDRSTQRFIASLFQRPSLATSERRRFSTVIKHKKKSEKVLPRVRYQASRRVNRKNKILAHIVPFDISVPRDFQKTHDDLQVDSGELFLKDRNSSTIKVIATNRKCEGNPQSKDSAERRALRACLDKEAKGFVQVFLDNAEYYHVLHDENWATNLTYGNKVHQESGRYFMVDSEKERKVIFTFREPSQGFVWNVEMTAPKGKRKFLANTQEIKKIISSLFFHASVVQER